MLKQISQEQRTLILLAFTKEILKNIGPVEKPIYQFRKPLEKTRPFKPKQIQMHPLARKIRRKPQFPLQPLIIPEPKLPQELNYFPTPTEEPPIEIEQFSPLIKDTHVRIIECYGAGKKIIVRGAMGVKPTNIILDKDEINEIIQKFSEATKIPLSEGIFRVAIGKLIFTAIPSKVIDAKFIIKKMEYPRTITHPKGF